MTTKVLSSLINSRVQQVAHELQVLHMLFVVSSCFSCCGNCFKQLPKQEWGSDFKRDSCYSRKYDSLVFKKKLSRTVCRRLIIFQERMR